MFSIAFYQINILFTDPCYKLLYIYVNSECRLWYIEI